jgi:proteasome accessory factor A
MGLGNGGWLDLGVVSRPEYATPECDGLAELIAHDKAGERILEDLVVDAGGRLRGEGIAGDICLVKNGAGHAYGGRESYLAGRRGEFGRLADMLIPFLVTRQVICGAGQVRPTPRGAVYCLSRQAEGVSPARSRPIINTRDEPNAAGRGFRRLRVVVGDPNMSETTTLLKAGATEVVLRMIEAGTVLPDLTLDNAIRTLSEVGRDITGRSRVRLASGRELSALGIQREYLARAQDFTGRNGADAATGRVLRLWERAVEAIETGNLDAIAREIDWVTKYQLIERYRARHDLPLSAPQVAELDLAYHDVHRGRGLYYQLQRSGAVDRVVRDLDIFEAKTVPPAGRRYRQAG